MLPNESELRTPGGPNGEANPHSDILGDGTTDLVDWMADVGGQLNEFAAELGIQIDQQAQVIVDAHVSDASAVHAASAVSFTPGGTISASTVQAAIAELGTEKSATNHTHTLDDLTDVSAATPSDGHVLKWVAGSSRWEPSPDLVGGGGGGATNLADLDDVDLTGLSTGQGLTYNGTDFVPATLALQSALATTNTNVTTANTNHTNHLNDTTGAHAASAISFTPTGTIAATTVQAAIAEVASEGGGGGGLSTEDVQDIVGAMVGAGAGIQVAYLDAFNAHVIGIDPATFTTSMISDFDENVKEVVGGPGIDVTSSSTQTTVSSLQPVINDYTTTTAWSKPADAVLVEVICIGAGGGGGSGKKGSDGSARGGGGGGASGNYARVMFAASELGSSETVTVSAAGGAGGPAVTAADTNGNAGSAGGATSFGAHVIANGGGGGGGGTTAGGTAGTVGARGTHPGMPGAVGGATAAASVIAGASLSTTVQSGYAGGGGGGGGGFDASNVAQGSSNGGNGPLFRTTTTAGGTGGGTGVAGGAGTAAGTYGGSGAGGGGGGNAGVSGAGGLAARGAGGGGSGASRGANNVAAGGAGGGGFMRVITYR